MWDLIHSYTRKQAHEDGLLIDLNTLTDEDLPRQAGFKPQTSITVGAFEQTIGSNVEGDTKGKTWDVLQVMLAACLKGRSLKTSWTTFKVVTSRGSGHTPVDLWCQIGPGDDREPVITIMLPDED